MKIKKVTVGTGELAYCIFGTGKINLVIEMGLGAVMGEWWQLARRLSKDYTVLLYERAGYGSSGPSRADRTPKNIADELHELLEVLDHESRITLLAHSQGGLYAQQFVRAYPELVERLVLLDPLSPRDNDFYETALREYEAAHDEQFLGGLASPDGFPPIPLILITHDSEIEEREICEFGGASKEEAQKIENIWQELMGEYLSYSPESRYIQAEHSSHYIHLTDAELVCKVLAE